MAIINWGDAALINPEDLKKTSVLLPEGVYQAKIKAVNVKLTSGALEHEDATTGRVGLTLDEAMRTVNPASPKGNVFGAMFNIELEVASGEYKGQKIKNGIWFCMQRDNPGLRTIKGLCAAIGLSAIPQETDKLLGHYVGVKLKIEKGTGGYSDKNVIAWFESAELDDGFAPDAHSTQQPDDGFGGVQYEDDIPF